MGRPRTSGWSATPRSVWHGFTQMATYADNRPIIVERAEGRELIDVDGRRYLDAISSLWVTTLGHRVPELDQAVRDQLDRVAHSTLLGNGNRIVIELAEALAPRVPVDEPHFLFASDGAAAVEQALKIAFQYWTNQGVTQPDQLPRLRRRLPRRHDRLALGRRRRVRHRRVRPAALPGPAHARPRRARCGRRRRRADRRARRPSWPRSSSSRSCRARPACASPPPERGRRRRRRLPGARRAADRRRGRHRLRAHRHAVRRPSSAGVRPDLLCLGKGITGGYLPLAATVASEPGVRGLPRPRPVGARPSTTGTPTAGTPSPRAVACRHLELIDEWDVLANVRARADQLGDAARRARRAARRPSAEVRRCGLMAGVELAPPADGLRWGRRVVGRLRRPGRADPPARRRGRAHAAAHHHRGRDRPHRRRARGVDRRGLRLVSLDQAADACVARRPADRPWAAWVDERLDAVATPAAGARRATSTPSAPRGTTRRRAGQRRRVVRVERLPRPRPRTPRWSPPPTTPSTAGAPARAPSRLVVGCRPVHARARGRRWPRGRAPSAAVLFPTGFAANLGVLTTLGGRRRPHLSRRAEPRVDHRRLPAGPRRRRGLPPRATSTRSTGSLGRRRRGPVDRRDRHRLLDGRRRRRRRRRSPRSAAATARCSCSTRPTPCSGPSRHPTTWPASTSSASARSPRRSARSAGSSPASGRVRRPARERGPARTSSPPP